MLPVSQEWIKNNDKTIRDRGLLRIDFINSHLNNIAANITTYFKDPISDLSQLKWTQPYDSVGGTGYISTLMSDSNGSVSEDVILRISLTSVSELSGITFRWSNGKSYATNFIVNFNGEDFSYTNNLSQTFVPISIEAGRSVEISLKINEWSKPNEPITIDRCFIGMWLAFDQGSIFSYSNKQSTDVLGNELPQSEITFELDNTTQLFDPLYYLSYYRYLSENTEIRTYYGFDLPSGKEWIQAGVHYLTEWKSPNNSYLSNFKARDILNLLYVDEIYSLEDKLTFVEYTDNILSYRYLSANEFDLLNLPQNPDGSNKWLWELPEDIKLKEISLPNKINSKRNNLQLICQAHGVQIRISNYGNIVFENMLDKQEDWDQVSIPRKILMNKPEFEVRESISSINVPHYNYSADDKFTEIYETTLQANEELSLIHDQAYTDLEIEIITGQESDLVNLISDWSLTTYLKRNSTTGATSFKVLRRGLIESKFNNIRNLNHTGSNLIISNYCLRSLSDSNKLLNKMEDEINLDRSVEFSLRIDPNLSVWDKLLFPFVIRNSEFAAVMRVSELELTFNGAYMGKVKGSIIGTIEGETIEKMYYKITNDYISDDSDLKWFSEELS